MIHHDSDLHSDSRARTIVMPDTAPSQLKSPASTPKRESPATIAAKEAPGWEKFLGVKSQTVTFTSEEATKFRAARDGSRSRAQGAAAASEQREQLHRRQQGGGGEAEKLARGRPGSRAQRRDVLNNFFHKMEENTKGETQKQLQSSENTPRTRREEISRGGNKKYQGSRSQGTDENHNLAGGPGQEQDKQQSLHLSRERSLKSISNWWRSSLEAGPAPPCLVPDTASPGPESPSPRHNHSHSDSGISSMSGRSSCMSPMSELSSSSGSSRTSLRSSSIVSASNILLEEDGEAELEYADLCRDLLLFAPTDSRLVGLISKQTDYHLIHHFVHY